MNTAKADQLPKATTMTSQAGDFTTSFRFAASTQASGDTSRPGFPPCVTDRCAANDSAPPAGQHIDLAHLTALAASDLTDAPLHDIRSPSSCDVSALSLHVRRRRRAAIVRSATDFCCKVVVVAAGIVIGSMYAQSNRQRPEAVLSPAPHAVPAGFGSDKAPSPAGEEVQPSEVAGETEFAAATLVPAVGVEVGTTPPAPNEADGLAAPRAPHSPGRQRRGPQGLSDPVTDEMPITFIYVQAGTAPVARA